MLRSSPFRSPLAVLVILLIATGCDTTGPEMEASPNDFAEIKEAATSKELCAPDPPLIFISSQNVTGDLYAVRVDIECAPDTESVQIFRSFDGAPYQLEGTLTCAGYLQRNVSAEFGDITDSYYAVGRFGSKESDPSRTVSVTLESSSGGGFF